MTEQNKRLASIFHGLASMYNFVGGDNPFRAMAYQKASQSIADLPEDIAHYLKDGSIREIPGIGESMRKDILEFTKTGQVLRFEKLKKRVPYALMELMDITGFGPESLKVLYKKLNVKNRAEVIEALESGRVSQLKGFGPRKIENMLRGLKLYKGIEDRMLLWNAMEEGARLIQWLSGSPLIVKVELAGSIRRRKETIGDIDIVAIVNEKDRKRVADYFTDKKICKKVLAKGETRVSIITANSGRQTDLRMINESEWGAALLYFTGSRQHIIHLRTLAKETGYKINEYGSSSHISE